MVSSRSVPLRSAASVESDELLEDERRVILHSGPVLPEPPDRFQSEGLIRGFCSVSKSELRKQSSCKRTKQEESWSKGELESFELKVLDVQVLNSDLQD